MSAEDAAQSAFLAAASRVYANVDASTLRALDDPALTVPGFATFEVEAQVPVRGWAHGDRVVLARFQNFGAVLDALDFRDDVLCRSTEALVSRLVWLHGPPYRLIEHLGAGEFGAREALDLRPRRDHHKDDLVSLRFALLDPGGRGVRPCVFQYRIVSTSAGTYRIETFQVAPLAR